MTMITADKYISIMQMSCEYNISMRALRLYEEMGLIRPKRLNRTRYYLPKDEMRLQLILKGKIIGLKLSEIKGFFRSILGDGDPTDDGGATIDFARVLNPERVIEMIAVLERKKEETSRVLSDLRAALRARPDTC